jgi:hypothetical protein
MSSVLPGDFRLSPFARLYIVKLFKMQELPAALMEYSIGRLGS